MGIQGTGLSEKNARLRFLVFIFCGIIAFGAILYWRQATLTNADYVEFDVPRAEKTPTYEGFIRSNKYKIEVEETSPSVK